METTSRDQLLKNRWNSVLDFLTEKFSETETIDIEGVLYLVGLQELGKIHQRFKKDDNVNIIHIGICTVLEPFGYYSFDFYDDDGLHLKQTIKQTELLDGRSQKRISEILLKF